MHFSIVIPLYNKEKHIKRAIESVLQQSYTKFEIIVVDDGSTDSSYTIVKKMKDERIRLISKINGGVSTARNLGIKNAKNDYIAFLDADDEWSPNYLKEIFNLIVKYPEAGAYATSYQFQKGNSKKEADLNLKLRVDELGIINYFESALKQPIISASSVTIPKKVFAHVGLFNEELNRGEDLEMWCRIGIHYDIAFKNTMLVIYHLDTENRSNMFPREYSKSFISKAEDILLNYNKDYDKTYYLREYIIKIKISKARYFIETNQRKKARKLLLRYKDTKYHKRNLFKTYLLTFKFIYLIRNLIKEK